MHTLLILLDDIFKSRSKVEWRLTVDKSRFKFDHYSLVESFNKSLIGWGIASAVLNSCYGLITVQKYFHIVVIEFSTVVKLNLLRSV